MQRLILYRNLFALQRTYLSKQKRELLKTRDRQKDTIMLLKQMMQRREKNVEVTYLIFIGSQEQCLNSKENNTVSKML